MVLRTSRPVTEASAMMREKDGRSDYDARDRDRDEGRGSKDKDAAPASEQSE